MNKSWLIASLLSAFAAVVRTIDGHSGPLAEARSSALSHQAITFYHITWYVLSVFFFVSAVYFFRLARGDIGAASPALANLLAILFFSIAAAIVVCASIFGWFVAAVMAAIVTSLVGIAAVVGGRSLTKPDGKS